MQALLRYLKHQRRAVAQEWARRSNAVQAAARLLREPDWHTQRMRALHDARGQLIRHGCTYRATGATEWKLVRSRNGRTNQVDLEVNGERWRTGSLRTAQRAIGSGKWAHHTK